MCSGGSICLFLSPPPSSLMQVKEKLQWLQGVGAPCGELGGDSTVGGEATAAGNPPLSPVAKDIAGYTLTLIEEHSRNEELVPGTKLSISICGSHR